MDQWIIAVSHAPEQRNRFSDHSHRATYSRSTHLDIRAHRVGECHVLQIKGARHLDGRKEEVWTPGNLLQLKVEGGLAAPSTEQGRVACNRSPFAADTNGAAAALQHSAQ
eukprot:1137065-Pelagomonas_calceolata.AAC.10